MCQDQFIPNVSFFPLALYDNIWYPPLPACRLFTVLTDEIALMHCPDFQHEGAACKIFTCCQLVNKRPVLACWDQSKLWSKDMKASDSMWRVGGGWGVYVCMCVCVCVIMHVFIFCSCSRTVWVINLCQRRAKSTVWHPADPRSLGASAAAFVSVKWRKHGNFQLHNHEHENMPG